MHIPNLRFRSLRGLLLGVVLSVLPLLAAAADPLYTAEVRVKSQSPGDTLNGTARALLQVLERVSGDPGVKSRPYLGPELKQARSLVKSSDFVQKEGLNAAGIPSFGTNMIVEFYPDRVRALAKRVGLQIWPEPRQQPLAWLVVDDGKKSPRLVSYRERSAAHALLDRGLYRGIRIVLPKGNAAEKVLTGAILRKDWRAVSAASAAYVGDTQLIGVMRRSGDGWKADWTFMDRGTKLREWSSEGTDPFEVMADGGNGSADALIRRYAIAGRPPEPPPLTEEQLAEMEAEKARLGAEDQQTETAAAAPGVSVVRESFTGIQNSADYSVLMGKLNAIDGVKSVMTVATTPAGVTVEITYQGDPSALRAAIALQGLQSGATRVMQQPAARVPPASSDSKPADTKPVESKSATPAAGTKGASGGTPAPTETKPQANTGQEF